MNVQRQAGDGFAKLGMLKTLDYNLRIPNILFPHTSTLKPPSFAEGIIHPSHRSDDQNDRFGFCVPSRFFSPDLHPCASKTSLSPFLFYPHVMSEVLHEHAVDLIKDSHQETQLIVPKKEMIDHISDDEPPMISIITSSAQLFRQPASFVNCLLSLRDKLGLDHLIYLPLLATPSSLALLTYLGVDLFDANAASLAADKQIMLHSSGPIYLSAMREIPCDCPACQTVSTIEDINKITILLHNQYALYSELKLVRNAIFTGELRGLVEQRIRTHPHLTSILNNLDIQHQSFLETVTPVIRKRRLTTTSIEGLMRPEVQRFQERCIYRYKKPPYASILLLLPCSATKPYSFSPTHKKIQQTLSKIQNQGAIHEVIITSPLGIVPRELELVYPASNYDIPVTGHWYHDELHMIKILVQAYLKQSTYDHIIIHLPSPLSTALQSILSDPIDTTIKDHPTSDDALDRLKEVLQEIRPHKPTISMQQRKKQIITSIASYQFGSACATTLLKGTFITGKYPYLRIMDANHQQLGMITKERGYISLTIEGARKIDVHESYWVEISKDFTLKGSVFAPGVVDADPQIREGDEVIVRQGSNLKAVGVATMSARQMLDSHSGEAVNTRHIISKL